MFDTSVSWKGCLFMILTVSSHCVPKLDVYESVHCDTIMKVTNKMQLYRLIYYSFVSSTCFGRCFRPSSGALDSIYSIW